MVICGQADAPNSIKGTCFNEHAVVGCEEKLFELFVLRKLMQITGDDDFNPMANPHSVVEIFHASAQRLGLTR